MKFGIKFRECGSQHNKAVTDWSALLASDSAGGGLLMNRPLTPDEETIRAAFRSIASTKPSILMADQGVGSKSV